MKTILFIHGGKVEKDTPSQRFLMRLNWAIDYCRQHTAENVIFLISGRWGRVTDNFPRSEAEVGRQYILQQLPDAKIIKEDISVEIIGNYAFSKPLIESLQPDKVILITSEILKERIQLIAQKLFAHSFTYSFQLMHDELSGNQVLLDKEVQAIKLFKKLFAEVQDGDDASARNTLLYKTPYYFKGIIDDKLFFDTYWEGGFDHYLHGIATRNSK